MMQINCAVSIDFVTVVVVVASAELVGSYHGAVQNELMVTSRLLFYFDVMC